jgi:hypothetical protein
LAGTGRPHQRQSLTSRNGKGLDNQFKTKRAAWSLMADDDILQ